MLQALAQFFSPFRLMKDTGRGSFEERVAAYRYNRKMRGHLPAYIVRWAVSCGVAVVLTAYFDSLGGGGSATLGPPGIFILLAAGCATFIAFGVCVMLTTAYVYFYLSHHDS